MTRFVRYARGLLVALAALALTAGVTFAAREMVPVASVAATPANPTITTDEGVAPAIDQNEDENVDQNEDENVDEGDDLNPDETPVEDGTDETKDRAVNHGAYVSEAAHADTPEGFDNHGQWVASIAKGSDGKTDQAAKHQAKAETKAAGSRSSITEKGAGRAKHAKR